MAQTNDISAPVKTTPKDIQVMASILNDLDVKEYEPRVLNQMLEFTHKYIGNILEDAQLYSGHAKKKTIDSSDILLAISLQQDRNFTSPPAKDVISEMARQRNTISLPFIKTTSGLRLPSDRYSLITANYHLKSNSRKIRSNPVSTRINMVSSPAVKAINKSSPQVGGIVPKTPTYLTPTQRPITTGQKPTRLLTDSVMRPTASFIVPPQTPTVSSAQITPTPNPIMLPTSDASKTVKVEDDDYDME